MRYAYYTKSRWSAFSSSSWISSQVMTSGAMSAPMAVGVGDAVLADPEPLEVLLADHAAVVDEEGVHEVALQLDHAVVLHGLLARQAGEDTVTDEDDRRSDAVAVLEVDLGGLAGDGVGVAEGACSPACRAPSESRRQDSLLP